MKIIASLILLASVALTAAQDPFLKKNAKAVEGPTGLKIVYEMHQLKHRTANKLVRANAARASARELVAELEKLQKAGESRLIEIAQIHGQSGQRVKVESIEEYQFGTEWNPPEIPQKSKGASLPRTSANPTAFETRNLGFTLEVEATLKADGVTCDLVVSPESITKVGELAMASEGSLNTEIAAVKNPIFQVMRTQTAIKVRLGEPTLLAIFTPDSPEDERVLALIRVDGVK